MRNGDIENLCEKENGIKLNKNVLVTVDNTAIVSGIL